MKSKWFVRQTIALTVLLGLITGCFPNKLTREKAANLIKDAWGWGKEGRWTQSDESYWGISPTAEKPPEGVDIILISEGEKLYTPLLRRIEGSLSDHVILNILVALQKEGYLDVNVRISVRKVSRTVSDTTFWSYKITTTDKGMKRFKCLVENPDHSSSRRPYPARMWALYPVCDLDVVVSGITQDGPKATVQYFYTTENFRKDTEFLEPYLAFKSEPKKALFQLYDDGWRVVDKDKGFDSE